MGTGTTLAAARQVGIQSAGTELFRLGALIAQLRLDPPPDFEAAIEAANRLADMKPTKASSSPPELANWMGRRNASQVETYKARLAYVRDIRMKRFLTVALSSSLRASSRWLPGSIKAQVDPNRSPSPIADQLRRSARLLARDCALENVNLHVSAVAILGDATCLPFGRRTFDAIITSPPYWSAYDYISTQRLTYMALGWSAARELQIGRSYGISPDGLAFLAPASMAGWYRRYGAEAGADGRSLREYIQRLRRHLQEAFRVVKPSGVVGYAIANSRRDRITFDLVAALAELGEEAGFSQVEVVDRPTDRRRILPAGRDSQTGRFSSDSAPGLAERVLFMRRTPPS